MPLLVNNRGQNNWISECIRVWQCLVYNIALVLSQIWVEGSFIRPLLKTIFQHSDVFIMFSFSLLSFNYLIYSSSNMYISKREAFVAENVLAATSAVLLGNLRTIRERVILPSSQENFRINALFIDQLVFSNFAIYVIKAYYWAQQGNSRTSQSRLQPNRHHTI